MQENAGDPDWILGWGIFPGGGNGNPFQYACLENPMDRGVGYSPWGCKESNTTECLSTHTGILHCQSLAIVKFCITAIYTEQEIKPQNMS